MAIIVEAARALFHPFLLDSLMQPEGNELRIGDPFVSSDSLEHRKVTRIEANGHRLPWRALHLEEFR
ncbi:MAG: hypothetical protein HY347_10015 [candidate division NC10 bacterium]|nr:hypothetical protein [candidate division NC10 bacterium]